MYLAYSLIRNMIVNKWTWFKLNIGTVPVYIAVTHVFYIGTISYAFKTGLHHIVVYLAIMVHFEKRLLSFISKVGHSRTGR